MIEILKGNIVETPELGILSITENGYLVLDDGVIEGIYPTLPERYRNEQVRDYQDALIMQSFADMHLHAPQYTMMGVGMDLPLIDWLNTYTFPFEAYYQDNEYARDSYRRLAKELIACGTTHVCMFSSLHVEATWILMEELENAGICGFVGKVNMDRNGMTGILEETTEESIRETIRWLNGCHFEHIQPILTPRFTPSCSNELLEELGRIAREKDLYVQSHLSENKREMQWVHNLHPDTERYYESYLKYGLFKEKTVMAHCVHSDETERTAMKEHGVVVAHCPDSNINLCSGICPVRKMLDEGLWVTLGSDIAGGALLAMNQVAVSAIKTSKYRSIMDQGQTRFLTVEEAYYLATTSGHQFFGLGKGLCAGDKLHAIVVDDHDFPKTPMDLSVKARFERALYLMQPCNIQAVWSDGRKVK